MLPTVVWKHGHGICPLDSKAAEEAEASGEVSRWMPQDRIDAATAAEAAEAEGGAEEDQDDEVMVAPPSRLSVGSSFVKNAALNMHV